MNTQANKILNEIEEWSKSDRENQCAAVALSDKTTGNYYLHYAGHSNDIGKCVHAIMEEDEETAFGIYAAATVFAHKHFAPETVENVNRMAAHIAELRKRGMTGKEIYEMMKTNNDNENDENENV